MKTKLILIVSYVMAATIAVVSTDVIADQLVSMATRGQITYCTYASGTVIAVPLASGCP